MDDLSAAIQRIEQYLAEPHVFSEAQRLDDLRELIKAAKDGQRYRDMKENAHAGRSVTNDHPTANDLEFERATAYRLNKERQERSVIMTNDQPANLSAAIQWAEKEAWLLDGKPAGAHLRVLIDAAKDAERMRRMLPEILQRLESAAAEVDCFNVYESRDLVRILLRRSS